MRFETGKNTSKTNNIPDQVLFIYYSFVFNMYNIPNINLYGFLLKLKSYIIYKFFEIIKIVFSYSNGNILIFVILNCLLSFESYGTIVTLRRF